MQGAREQCLRGTARPHGQDRPWESSRPRATPRGVAHLHGRIPWRLAAEAGCGRHLDGAFRPHGKKTMRVSQGDCTFLMKLILTRLERAPRGKLVLIKYSNANVATCGGCAQGVTRGHPFYPPALSRMEQGTGGEGCMGAGAKGLAGAVAPVLGGDACEQGD